MKKAQNEHFMLPAAGLLLVLVVSACSAKTAAPDPEITQRRETRAQTTLTLVYPPWSSEIAGAYLFQAVLQERLGYRVELTPVEAEGMWRRVAQGKADFLTGAWLPVTHKDYKQKYGSSLVDLGANLAGARIGLVVPAITPGRGTEGSGKTGRELVTIHSIDELHKTADRFDGRIIGIESGAGITARTKKAITAYGLESLYYLVESTEEQMINRVAEAVQRSEWIVFTGWRPHRIFELYNLRFLEDPNGIFGGTESIHTMTRTGLREDAPDAVRLLERISYEVEDLERLMRWIDENKPDDPYRQALRWIRVNQDRVDEWVEGIE